MIEISLNGERREVTRELTLSDALTQWGYLCERVAVAVNGEFVARVDYPRTRLQSTDRVDVVGPVQGG
jgi:sulfur carrier protein